jgi:glyoxalase/bleomycin resistance protein/dioxygenase superfamily protein
MATGNVPQTMAHPLYEQPWPEGEYRFFQIGFLVDDVIAAAARWAAVFGVGPFLVLPRLTTASVYRGREAVHEVQVATAQAGPVQIELIQQHCDRPSIYRELFPAGGNGLHQLCTVTDDYEGKKAHYAGLGYELAGEISARGHRVAYIDTVADFGFFTEVVESNAEFLGHLARHAQTCAHWDGVDPVRLLTRDGYRTP